MYPLDIRLVACLASSPNSGGHIEIPFLRFSLLPQDRPPILEAVNAVPPATTREEYLRKLFTQRVNFQHWRRTLVYVPLGVEEQEGELLLFGRIGRPIAAIENAPPEADFEETTRTSWRAANVIIDTSDHSDGQKMAFQHHLNVGRPLPIASGLVNHINETNRDSGWLIEINLITERRSFWEAAERYRGELTSAEFTFVTPNILGISSNLTDELKEIRGQHNATSVTATINNPNRLCTTFRRHEMLRLGVVVG